jgi:hypothetical protein
LPANDSRQSFLGDTSITRLTTAASALPFAVGIGTPEHAEALLQDLYIRLRRDLQRWASVTQQTPQPRMGYVGQHLVSVVTGYPGGRSGARGDDLKLPGGKCAEIKCCYRVDQLGQCRACGTAVASLERICPNQDCRSTLIERKDDSKWLLAPRDEKELREMFVPVCYYLVLFEFRDLAAAEDIDVSIYHVDPQHLGFSLCMIDYYFNIRSKSKSKAPFNLWPQSPKLLMMKPQRIYWAIIHADDKVETKLFPNRDEPVLHAFGPLTDYARPGTITEEAVDALATRRSVSFARATITATGRGRLAAKLKELEQRRKADKWSDVDLADDLARSVYTSKVNRYGTWLKEFAPSL